MKEENAPHKPVMVNEVVQFFRECALKVFFEGTLGAGGHAQAILSSHPEIQSYIACDKDPDAIKLAAKVLHPWEKKIFFVQGDFADLEKHLEKLDIDRVDGFFLISASHRCKSTKPTKGSVFRRRGR